MKSSKSRIFIFIVFLIVSLGLITGGTFIIAKNIKDRDKYAKTTATITRLEEDDDGGTAYVSYEVNGIEYKDVRLNFYDNFMYKGKEITISYLKENPNKIKSEKENYTVGVILLVMGVIFALSDGYILYDMIKKKI